MTIDIDNNNNNNNIGSVRRADVDTRCRAGNVVDCRVGKMAAVGQ